MNPAPAQIDGDYQIDAHDKHAIYHWHLPEKGQPGIERQPRVQQELFDSLIDAWVNTP